VDAEDGKSSKPNIDTRLRALVADILSARRGRRLTSVSTVDTACDGTRVATFLKWVGSDPGNIDMNRWGRGRAVSEGGEAAMRDIGVSMVIDRWRLG
jgi:hypothetical protein